jgi:hypothetical protein
MALNACPLQHAMNPEAVQAGFLDGDDRKTRARPGVRLFSQLGEVVQQPRNHPSNNLAKLPFDFSVRVPRTQLRPRYGDGFDGAPLTGRR